MISEATERAIDTFDAFAQNWGRNDDDVSRSAHGNARAALVQAIEAEVAAARCHEPHSWAEALDLPVGGRGVVE